MGVSTGSGLDGVDAEAGYFSEFLSARISRHPIFTDMKFWQHVLQEAVQTKTEKVRINGCMLFIGWRRFNIYIYIIFIVLCL